ncbi:hypothetical protein CC1G_05023 [Coprinopsis cinerea okayama7|uniref:Uncharacterized protein n=1 Tax=Coprinopsis cinerea (strain Okayama-7 / 130 / ATCC MYA-4618 / FGSC 9003) TaxID=240176 RepID=A8NSK2_COPC7|nr:hypothetical protein CC1G_05023 [Coprinopsis cinerea okayama7\|eukprot:XP_001836030.2 hypothetical protein CC1G_05023 [Coprinopsis cinerea okayama7\
MASPTSSATSTSTVTPTRRALKRHASARNLMQMCNSSDTEEPWTPPRKRFRFLKDEDSPAFSRVKRSGSNPLSPASSIASLDSSSSSGSPSKRRRKQPTTICDLTSTLRKCASNKTPIDQATIQEIKNFPRGESDALASVRQLLKRVKVLVKTRFDKAGEKILATELYLEWLQELDFVVSAIENLLSAKVPGTRRRVPGLGRLSFTILYLLMDEFISEVDSHHDGWSYRTPEWISRSNTSIYPDTMTIIEESHDPSTDVRTDLAVREAEDFLTRYDNVMADAVRRYKIECGRSNPNLADAIGSKEYALSRACCLLCEQTGYGSNDNDTGDTLLQETRAAMQEWKQEFGSDASGEVENDELTSD